MIRGLHELGDRGRRRLLDRRRGRAAHPPRRSSGLHRRRAAGGELPQDPVRDRRRDDDPLRGRPPRLGFPRREPGLRRSVSRHDLVFIGPSADTMRRWATRRPRGRRWPLRDAGGSRDAARHRSTAPPQRTWPATRSCSRRSPGAGGRGCASPLALELDGSFQTATAEAQSAFGDPALYLEKAIVPARHVEIEGSPTPGRRPAARRTGMFAPAAAPATDRGGAVAGARRPRRGPQMEDAAERAARAVDYRNAGTFEFILGADRAFYFIELNAQASGRAPGQRAPRPASTSSSKQLRIAGGGEALDDGACRATRPRDRDPHRRRGSGPRIPPGTGAHRAVRCRRSAPGCGSTRTWRTAPWFRRTTTRSSRGPRLGLGPACRDRPQRCVRSASSKSSACPRPRVPRATSSGPRSSRPGGTRRASSRRPGAVYPRSPADVWSPRSPPHRPLPALPVGRDRPAAGLAVRGRDRPIRP